MLIEGAAVYRRGMRRDEASKRALRELVGLDDWAAMGSGGDLGADANRAEFVRGSEQA
jgi:hypothetical protein